MKVTCLGMYFNETAIESDKEPSQELTIKKSVLDRSSGNIIARFEYSTESRTKLVYQVFFDDKPLMYMGTNIPVETNSGFYDTILLHYPNSAKANKLGKHKIRVVCGLIPNIVLSKEGLVDWKPAQAISEANFVINLE